MVRARTPGARDRNEIYRLGRTWLVLSLPHVPTQLGKAVHNKGRAIRTVLKSTAVMWSNSGEVLDQLSPDVDKGTTTTGRNSGRREYHSGSIVASGLQRIRRMSTGGDKQRRNPQRVCRSLKIKPSNLSRQLPQNERWPNSAFRYRRRYCEPRVIGQAEPGVNLFINSSSSLGCLLQRGSTAGSCHKNWQTLPM